MQIAILGIDLGKNSCSLAGFDVTGQVVMRRRMRREGLVKLASSLPVCVVAIEPVVELIISGVCFRNMVMKFD